MSEYNFPRPPINLDLKDGFTVEKKIQEQVIEMPMKNNDA